MTTVPHRGTVPPPREPQALVAKPIFDWFFVVGVLAMVALYVRSLAFTPPDALQGMAQKIYYIHIPAWLASYTAVGITALTSVVYLWLHDERADRLSEASAEIGLVFLTGGLSTGMFWGRVIWGAWWVWWDMRLTLTLFLWFVVAAYLVLRGAIEDEAMRARYSAVLAVLAALLIPFIHLSVYLFSAGMHPMPVVLQPGEPKLSPQMLVTFLCGFAAFELFCIALIRARYRYAVQRDILATLDTAGDVR